MRAQAVRSFSSVVLVALALSCGGGGGGGEDLESGPTLIGSNPDDGATDAPLDGLVFLEWEQDLDPSSVDGHVEALTALGSLPVVLDYDSASKRIRVQIDEGIARGARYTVRVSPGLATAAGRVLDAPYEISYRTREGSLQSTQLLETEAVDTAIYRGAVLNADGRGFASGCSCTLLRIERCGPRLSTRWLEPVRRWRWTGRRTCRQNPRPSP